MISVSSDFMQQMLDMHPEFAGVCRCAEPQSQFVVFPRGEYLFFLGLLSNFGGGKGLLEFSSLTIRGFRPDDFSGGEADPVDDKSGARLNPSLSVHQPDPQCHDWLGHESGRTSPTNERSLAPRLSPDTQTSAGFDSRCGENVVPVLTYIQGTRLHPGYPSGTIDHADFGPGGVW